MPSQDLQSLLRAAQEKCVLCSVSLKSLWEIRSSALSTERYRFCPECFDSKVNRTNPTSAAYGS